MAERMPVAPMFKAGGSGKGGGMAVAKMFNPKRGGKGTSMKAPGKFVGRGGKSR